MAKILIKNGRIWDGEKFFYADVLTSDNKIEKIEPDICEKASFVYDASGKTVTAGLVDSHIHMRGISRDIYGAQAEMCCFPFGVTAAADAEAVLGDCALLDSFMLKNVVFVPVAVRNDELDVTNTEKLLEIYGDHAVGIKLYFDDTMSEVSSINALVRACEYAHSKGLRLMVHCSNSPTKASEILNALSAGDILTHAFHGGKNTVLEDGFESLKKAQERGVIVDIGMAGNVHVNFNVLENAIKSGIVPFSISTDITKNSLFQRGGRYGLTMCMSIVEHLGLPEADVLRAVTSNPARSLGKANEWGYLKVGRTADIAVLDREGGGFDITDKQVNHINSKRGYRCVLTVADGILVYRD